MAAKAHKEGGPLLVRVGLNAGGSTYALDPLSEDRVREAFPEAHGLPMVFFGYNTPGEFDTLHRPLWPQAAQLLTGLTMEQIGQLGGLKFSDAKTEATIWEWLFDGATEAAPARDPSCSDSAASRARSK
jgi:hypothetical protein